MDDLQQQAAKKVLGASTIRRGRHASTRSMDPVTFALLRCSGVAKHVRGRCTYLACYVLLIVELEDWGLSIATWECTWLLLQDTHVRPTQESVATAHRQSDLYVPLRLLQLLLLTHCHYLHSNANPRNTTLSRVRLHNQRFLSCNGLTRHERAPRWSATAQYR